MIASLRLGLSALLELSGGGDIVNAPLRLRTARGSVLAEVIASMSFSRALEALQASAASLLAPSLLERGLGSAESATAGAAVAVGAGEAFLSKSPHQP